MPNKCFLAHNKRSQIICSTYHSKRTYRQLSIGMQTFFWSIEFASFSWLLLKSFWHSGGKKIWRVKCHSNLLSFLLLCRYDWLWVKSIWRESVIGLFIHFYLELFFTWWYWSFFLYVFRTVIVLVLDFFFLNFFVNFGTLLIFLWYFWNLETWVILGQFRPFYHFCIFENNKTKILVIFFSVYFL